MKRDYAYKSRNYDHWKTRNRQDLIEVFKICKEFSRTSSNELFHFGDRGERVQEVTLVRCTRDSRRLFF